MKITGELLRSERMKKNLTVQDVSSSLKLSPRTITAIESGDLSQLPAKTFVRGFVRSYSDYLKLDSTYVLNLFQEEVGTTKPVPVIEEIKVPARKEKSEQAFAEKKEAKSEMSESLAPSSPIASNSSINQSIQDPTLNFKNGLNRNTIITVIVILFGIIAITGINSALTKYQKESQQSQVEEALHPTEPVVVQSQPAAPEPVGKDLKFIDQIMSMKFPSLLLNHKEEEKPAEKPPEPVTETTGDVETTQIEQKEEITAEEAEAAPKKSIEIVLEALKDTSISYAKGNSKEFKNFDLKENTFQIIKSSTGLLIKIKNGNAVQVTVNGISQGLASKNDAPVELKY